MRPLSGRLHLWMVAAFLVLSAAGSLRAQQKPDYAAVHQLLTKHCLDCHAAQEPEAKLVLESFEALMKGGESGRAIVPRQSSESLLVKMIEGTLERDGKRRIMPPGRRPKLTLEEIALVRAWIDAGATPPAAGSVAAPRLVVPHIVPKGAPRRPIQALAYTSHGKLLAIGRYNEVELMSVESRLPVRVLTSDAGTINALTFSADGQFLFAGAGEAGVRGAAVQWRISDGSVVRTFSGHTDTLYALALSPDGKTLATGSYDQKIKLWNVDSGAELKKLSGHNGAIFDLAFRPDGAILASASADRTVKLWDVMSGERRDTLSQALKEVQAVVFSPDGKRLFAAGADNRIRVWEISEKALETTNPILESRFAHEGAILRLALASDGKTLLSSASDQTVKVWDTAELREKLALERQPDWVAAVASVLDSKGVAVGRLDGSLQFYDAASGKVLPPPKPTLVRAEPRGLQRGVTAKVKLVGTNLSHPTEVRSSDSRLKVELMVSAGTGARSDEAWIQVTPAAEMPRTAVELSLVNQHGESGKVKLQIDDLPQVYLGREGGRVVGRQLDSLPASVWATHAEPGDAEELTFEANAGQTFVFDAAAKSLGSKADLVLTLSDATGKVVASSNGVGSSDALLAYPFSAGGTYKLRVAELVLAGSSDHFYRLSVGSFPYVTGCFPLSVPVGKESSVELVGYNLPPDHAVNVAPDHPGSFVLPVDQEKFRGRPEFSLIASDNLEMAEAEPNDSTGEATAITPPCAVAGRIWQRAGGPDTDCFRFAAKAGQTWIIQTEAWQRGSPVDTKIEVLTADGKPVERLQLQAVRDSAVTFRSIDSDTIDCRVVNWEEMELNQLLYLQGEVVKLFRAPQGPDSGFLFYSANGRRRCYFDTSPAGHAVDEPCFIVEPHASGTRVVANGLPVFPVYYVNDDDAERKLGADSKLQFTAPGDGNYLIRVTDTRGLSGDRFAYRLVVRTPEPDFRVQVKGSGLTVNAGSGQGFAIQAERFDGFDGEIMVAINHLPPGFLASTPLVIQAGHSEARGTLHADLNAPKPTAENWAKVEVTATAIVGGQAVVKALNNFGTVALADKPKLFVALEPAEAKVAPGGVTSSAVQQVAAGTAVPGLAKDKPLEITIAPGQTVPAWLRVQRNGYDELITFTVDNLPHGIIVDNIGLNGVLIPKGQSERQIFLSAARWVPDTDRLCYAVESQAGQQTSLPVLLHVRRNAGLQAATH